MKQDLLTIINNYGLDKQLKYIHSEYFELDESIWDYQNSGWDFNYEDAEQLEREYKHHIAEEISDVMVMLKQFQYYYDIEDEEIEDIMKYKIQRQLERIKEGKIMKKEEILKLIDELCEDLEKRESGDSYIYDFNGNRITMDVGYAFEGIDFFVKELKHKLGE